METADKNEILAWHFVNDDLALNHDMKHLRVYPGLSLEVDADKLDLCNYGLHASIEPLDALKYAPGAGVCRVQMSGRIIQDTDKLVASRRLVIWCADATRTLHEFAIWCAEQALVLIGKPDPRSIEALRIKRLWLDGAATDAELHAAGAAAGDAAWDAAGHAAWDAAGHAAWAAAWAAAGHAAWDAAGHAAGAAAGDAAWAAAGHAAGAAAGDAAWAAAWAAARDAAWDAAGAAARDAQNKQLHHMLFALEKEATPAPAAGDGDGAESER